MPGLHRHQVPSAFFSHGDCIASGQLKLSMLRVLPNHQVVEYDPRIQTFGQGKLLQLLGGAGIASAEHNPCPMVPAWHPGAAVRLGVEEHPPVPPCNSCILRLGIIRCVLFDSNNKHQPIATRHTDIQTLI